MLVVSNSDGVSSLACDDTLRIKVDPWTGKILSDFPDQPPPVPDPDVTSRVDLDPWTGDLLSAIDQVPDEQPPIGVPTSASPGPFLGFVATVALTSGAVTGAVVMVLLMS